MVFQELSDIFFINTYCQVEKAFKSLGAITETVLQEAQEYISSEQKSLQEAKALAENTSKAEIARLQQQNALLSRLLESEKTKAERAKDELLSRISGLLGNFTLERDRSLREAFAEMSESNSAAEAGMTKLGKEQTQKLDAVIGKGNEWSSTLERRAGENKRTRDGGFKASAYLSKSYGVSDVLCRLSRPRVPLCARVLRTCETRSHHLWRASPTTSSDKFNRQKLFIPMVCVYT